MLAGRYRPVRFHKEMLQTAEVIAILEPSPYGIEAESAGDASLGEYHPFGSCFGHNHLGGQSVGFVHDGQYRMR